MFFETSFRIAQFLYEQFDGRTGLILVILLLVTILLIYLAISWKG